MVNRLFILRLVGLRMADLRHRHPLDREAEVLLHRLLARYLETNLASSGDLDRAIIAEERFQETQGRVIALVAAGLAAERQEAADAG
jgi:hypothetical protein